MKINVHYDLITTKLIEKDYKLLWELRSKKDGNTKSVEYWASGNKQFVVLNYGNAGVDMFMPVTDKNDIKPLLEAI